MCIETVTSLELSIDNICNCLPCCVLESPFFEKCSHVKILGMDAVVMGQPYGWATWAARCNGWATWGTRSILFWSIRLLFLKWRQTGVVLGWRKACGGQGELQVDSWGRGGRARTQDLWRIQALFPGSLQQFAANEIGGEDLRRPNWTAEALLCVMGNVFPCPG